MAARAAPRLKGFLTRIANKKKNVYVRHKLDSETDKYFKTLHNVVIPECMDLVNDIPGFSERVKECISYTTPSYFIGWNFSIELVYKTVAEEHHQTEKNLEKTRMLRALMDICYAMARIIDDYVDKGEIRHGKKIWAAVCEGGQEVAVNNSIAINYLINRVLQRHFRNDPGYTKMLELFAMVYGTAAIGNTLDILDRFNTSYNGEMWKHTVRYKASKPISAPSGVALAHAGIIDDDLIAQTTDVFGYCGHLFQVWDDLMEHYGMLKQSGKGFPDIKYNIKSWATMTAMEHFNKAQAKQFRECYGSNDPEKKAIVRALFDEVDLHLKYVDYLSDVHKTMENKISKIPNPKIRSACTSYVDWLLVEEPEDVELEEIKAF